MPFLGRFVKDVTGNGLVVVDRLRVRHASYGSKAAGDRGECAGGNVFLVLKTRIAQVDMNVDQARSDNFSSGVDNLGTFIIKAFADRGDLALFDQDIAGLIKLLCRLYDPVQGTIKMDGIDLRRFETTALRREIGVIFQDYTKYHLTARENIWFGNIDLLPEDKRIATAGRETGADDLITRLPKGYETILGKWFDDGEELSIGEWQKIALARAFLRDAQIIVLDEPTSALDAKSEYEVFRNFRKLLDGRSAVLISHRFSTVRMADRIFVFDGGKIKEQGTHEHLMRLGGTYAEFFEKQAQHYK